MATANDLITSAFRRGRILGHDQTPSASEAADALSALNRMLDAWSNKRLLVYQVVQEQFTLSSGNASRTIGSGGNFNTTWPVKIVDGCFVRRDGIDHPVTVLDDRTQYDALRVKSQSGIPFALFYDRAYPLGTVYFYYTPDANDAVYLNLWKRLATLAALVTAVSLPPGYEDLVIDGLALKLCPEYGIEPPADVRRNFTATLRDLGNVNAQSLVMTVDQNLLPRSAGYDIRNQ